MDTKTLEVSANHRDDVVVENSPRHTSTVSAHEVPVAAGSKRTRGLDESEDRYNLTPDTGEVCARGDATGISTIIMRAKRLRIGDSAPPNGDEERHHFLILEAQREEKKLAILPDNTQYLMIPETPSLSGLPEELIIEILQNLVVCDIIAFRRVR
jgi:F-box domain